MSYSISYVSPVYLLCMSYVRPVVCPVSTTCRLIWPCVLFPLNHVFNHVVNHVVNHVFNHVFMFSGVSFVAESCQLEGAGISIPGSPKNVPLSSILESGTVFEMAACKTGSTGSTGRTGTGRTAASRTSSLVQFPHLFLKRAYDDYCGENVHQPCPVDTC